VPYLSQCPVLQIFIGDPLGLLNVLNCITLLSVVGFFTCCVSFVYVLRFVYVVYVLFTFVYVPFVFICCVIRGLIR